MSWNHVVLSGVLACTFVQAAQKPLQIYFIDVEGGQSTLFVTPAGESLLVDTGWPGNNGRDAGRIAAAAKLAKIKKLDYVLITHYHDDHVGGVAQLVEKLPVGTFIDHGPNNEKGEKAEALYSAYQKAGEHSKHLTVKPGDKLPIKGMDAVVVTSNGEVLSQPLPGAGQPNPACSGIEPKRPDPSENARSLGIDIGFGKLKILDLGDLTWNKELELVCPSNKLGKVDIYITSHHGLAASGSPALINGIAPRVAVMNNGSTKGGQPAAWDVIKKSPGLEDLWQIHLSEAGGTDHNTDSSMIANNAPEDTGYYLKLTANPDGSFELFNPRTNYTKRYPRSMTAGN